MRILIVEDNADDADLLLRELRRGGLDIAHERVETEAAMNAALDTHSWEMVIADYSLPHFSGLAALALVQRRGLDMPFILVSGNVGEETAVAAMKAGASDYLMKGKLARLVPAVQRELRDAEGRREAQRTERNLRERDAQLAEERKLAEQELRAARDALEARVRERTAELSQANAVLQEQQLKLEAARRAAEAANQSKSDFLANMSHEIRTPMAALLGYADMLLDPQLSASDRMDHVHTIRRNAEHLLTVLNDILDLSKIEAGKLQVELIDTDARQVVNDVLSLMRVRAVEKGLSLDVTYAGAIPQTIQTDPTRLRQVLNNLVANAIKFTERGGVNVVVALASGEANQPQLEFAVVDSGIGMNAKQMGQLFKPFEQGDTSTTRKYGGTGLGLMICWRLARMLGGDIKAQSHPNAGSRFVLRIDIGDLAGVPLLTEPRESIKPQERSASSGQSIKLRGTVLLAEDGIHNQRVISYYLQKAGAQVVLAQDGRVACEKFAEAQKTGRRIDAVLMDMQMPELDGYSAAATLRSRGYKGPIIALTAQAMSQDRERCLTSGCNDYLTKPVDRNLLISTLAAHLQGAARPVEAAPPRPPLSLAAIAKPAESLPSDVLRSTLVDDPEMCSFLPAFVADLPALVSRLTSLLDKQDLKELGGTIHQIKGAGGVYGFMPLTDAAAHVESTIAAARCFEEISGEVRRLIDLIRSVEGYQSAKLASAT